VRGHITFLMLALLLSGCDIMGPIDPIGDICFNCVDAPANAPLAQADAARLRLIHGGTLPAGARNVYYAEECGIDCIQWIRFDVPAAAWETLLERLRDGAQSRTADGEMMSAPGDPAWWRIEPEGTAEQLRLAGPQGWPLSLLSYPVGEGQIRVFLVANQM
jgi:hypothetical protein